MVETLTIQFGERADPCNTWVEPWALRNPVHLANNPMARAYVDRILNPGAGGPDTVAEPSVSVSLRTRGVSGQGPTVTPLPLAAALRLAFGPGEQAPSSCPLVPAGVFAASFTVMYTPRPIPQQDLAEGETWFAIDLENRTLALRMDLGYLQHLSLMADRLPASRIAPAAWGLDLIPQSVSQVTSNVRHSYMTRDGEYSTSTGMLTITEPSGPRATIGVSFWPGVAGGGGPQWGNPDSYAQTLWNGSLAGIPILQRLKDNGQICLEGLAVPTSFSAEEPLPVWEEVPSKDGIGYLEFVSLSGQYGWRIQPDTPRLYAVLGDGQAWVIEQGQLRALDAKARLPWWGAFASHAPMRDEANGYSFATAFNELSFSRIDTVIAVNELGHPLRWRVDCRVAHVGGELMTTVMESGVDGGPGYGSFIQLDVGGTPMAHAYLDHSAYVTFRQIGIDGEVEAAGIFLLCYRNARRIDCDPFGSEFRVAAAGGDVCVTTQEGAWYCPENGALIDFKAPLAALTGQPWSMDNIAVGALPWGDEATS